MTRLTVITLFLLAACALPSVEQEAPAVEPVSEAPAAPPPAPSARSVEEFDTTTEEQRIAAAEPSRGGQLLGTTVASLGDPTVPGFWIETALVSEIGTGRLVYPANGKSVEVELRPVPDGSARVSLAALRLLDAPLTGLPTLEVYAD